jgi:cytochrome c6
LGVALLATTCLVSSPAKADVAAGEATYKAKCAMCHGADGKGKESMKTPDFTSADVQKKSDADPSGIITSGKGKMPAYKTMTPDQVKDMVAFIRSLKK